MSNQLLPLDFMSKELSDHFNFLLNENSLAKRDEKAERILQILGTSPELLGHPLVQQALYDAIIESPEALYEALEKHVKGDEVNEL